LRRISYLRTPLLADTIVIFSPTVRREFSGDAVIGWIAKKMRADPLPIADSELRRKLAAARNNGPAYNRPFRIGLSQKQPTAPPDVAAVLKKRGRKPLTAYTGSLTTSFTRIRASGISNDVIISCYSASQAPRYSACSRSTSSVILWKKGLPPVALVFLPACNQAAVIATGPAQADEFDHDPRFRALVENGAIGLATRDSLIKSKRTRSRGPSSATAADLIDFAGWWHDTAKAIEVLIESSVQ
jgi:hypothetical protein